MSKISHIQIGACVCLCTERESRKRRQKRVRPTRIASDSKESGGQRTRVSTAAGFYRVHACIGPYFFSLKRKKKKLAGHVAALRGRGRGEWIL